MKVILVNGSPHEHGCTYTALREAEKALNADGIDTEIFWLGKKPVSGCIACGACRKLGKCFMEDAVNEFTALAKEADGFIRYKPAAAVASCRRAGGTATLDMLNKYFTISCMPVVSSSYWNEIHGNTAEEASKDAEGLQTMRTLGHNMAWLLKCIEAGRGAGIEPTKEKKVYTNFIR